MVEAKAYVAGIFRDVARAGGAVPHLPPEACEQAARIVEGLKGPSEVAAPIPMRIPCPDCGELHIDEGEFATKPHHTHSCQSCGLTWRPAVVPTVGVRFLPGFKNNEPDASADPRPRWYDPSGLLYVEHGRGTFSDRVDLRTPDGSTRRVDFVATLLEQGWKREGWNALEVSGR